MFHAYTLLEKDHGCSGIKGFDFLKIAKMLCIEYPPDIVSGIIRLLDKREEENVDFDEFLCGVRTITMFNSFFEEMDSLFKHLDTQRKGQIKMEDLVTACNKLNDKEVGPHDLRVPKGESVNSAANSVKVAEEGSLNYDEFQILMFKTMTEDFE